MIEMKDISYDSNADFFCGYFRLLIFLFKTRSNMMNGEHNDGQLSDTYIDNIIKQLEISDGSQATSCVRYITY